MNYASYISWLELNQDMVTLHLTQVSKVELQANLA